jgi:hypothetical protein
VDTAATARWIGGASTPESRTNVLKGIEKFYLRGACPANLLRNHL